MKTILQILLLINLFGCNPASKNKTHISQDESLLAVVTPESQGVNSEQLIELIDFVKNENINLNSIVIARNGKMVLDAHFYPNKKEYLHDVASVTKSITSAILGVAIDKGYIKDENAKVSDFFPEHKILFDSEWKKDLTIKHLLTMTSGLCSDFGDGERQLDEMRLDDNSIKYILSQELVSKPEREFAYCSCATQLLSAIIQKATGKTMEEYGKETLFKELEISDFIFTKDKSGITNGWGDSYWLTSDLLKMGQLYLQNGEWKGKQIISKEWVKKSSSEQVRLENGEESYGYKWWIPNQLEGLYEGRGRGDQRLVVYPKENLVVVMTGTGFDPGEVGGYIINALKSRNQLPENPKAYNLLKERLIEIQQAPEAQMDVVIPDLAKEIDGLTLKFEENSFGLTHFKLFASDVDDAKLVLGLDISRSEEYGEREIPLGMNGQNIISNNTRFKTPMAAKAVWLNDNMIEIDYNDFSSNHKYRIRIRFNSKTNAVWEMYDEAGFGESLTLNANLKNE